MNRHRNVAFGGLVESLAGVVLILNEVILNQMRSYWTNFNSSFSVCSQLCTALLQKILIPMRKIEIIVSSFLTRNLSSFIINFHTQAHFALSSLLDCQIKAHWKNESPCIWNQQRFFWHFQTISLTWQWGNCFRSTRKKKNSGNAVKLSIVFFTGGFVLYCWRKDISLSV